MIYLAGQPVTCLETSAKGRKSGGESHNGTVECVHTLGTVWASYNAGESVIDPAPCFCLKGSSYSTFDIWMYILDQLKCTITDQLPIQAHFSDRRALKESSSGFMWVDFVVGGG